MGWCEQDQQARDRNTDAPVDAQWPTDSVLDLGHGAPVCFHEHDQRHAGTYEAKDDEESKDVVGDYLRWSGPGLTDSLICP